MRLSRIPALLLAAILGPLAIAGLWAEHALNDSTGFADSMTEALDDPDVLAELEILATDAATQKIYEYFSVTGPGQHTLADTAVAYAQGVLDSSLQSPVFQSGWHAWQSSLHKDLATIARGGTPPVTTVDGSQISVDITPLVRSLLTGPVGFLARSALGDEPMIKSIDAGEDVESQLAWLGRIAAVRWWAVLGFVVIVAVAALQVPGRRLQALGVALLAAGVGCLVALLGRWIYHALVTVDETAIGRAAEHALAGAAPSWLVTAAVLFGLVGAALLALPALRAARAKHANAHAQLG